MPTYEYECLECKHRFDLFHSITDETIKKCEKCGKNVKKIIGAAGIIFKGDGFYVNDYKKNEESRKKQAPVDSKSSSDTSPCNSCDSACSSST